MKVRGKKDETRSISERCGGKACVTSGVRFAAVFLAFTVCNHTFLWCGVTWVLLTYNDCAICHTKLSKI